jgi:hypothetical protein
MKTNMNKTSRLFQIISAAAMALPLLLQSVHAQDTVYTLTEAGAGSNTTWSSGTSWSSVPASSSTTELTFNININSGVSLTNTDDISGAFLLNALDLNGTGLANSSGSSLTIAGNGSNNLELTGTAPVVNLNGNTTPGYGALSFTVSAPISLDSGVTFQGGRDGSF